MTHRRRKTQKAVFTFRTTTATAQKIRSAAAREERLVGWFLRRLVERAIDEQCADRAAAESA